MQETNRLPVEALNGDFFRFQNIRFDHTVDGVEDCQGLLSIELQPTVDKALFSICDVDEGHRIILKTYKITQSWALFSAADTDTST